MGSHSELVQSGQLQLKHFGQFIDQHQHLLKNLGSDNFFSTANNNDGSSNIIGLDFSANRENLTLFQLIESDNKVLNKIMLVFANLIDQTHNLCNEFEANYRAFLSIDEEFTTENTAATTIRCSEFLDFLFTLKFQVKQLQNLVLNLVKQIAALCNLEIFISTTSKSINYLQFQIIFQHIAKCLNMIIIFDEMIMNSNLRQIWPIYCKSMKSMRKNLSHFGNEFSSNSLDAIESVLDDLNWLFEGKAFQEFLENVSEIRSEFHGKSVSYFSAHLLMHLKTKYTELEKLSPNLTDYNETQEVLRLTLMFGLYHQLFGNLEPKNIRNVLELNNKIHGITLIGNTIWCWEVFIKTNFPTLLKGASEKYATEANRSRRLYLQTKIQTLIKDTQIYSIQICDWVYKMQNSLKVETSSLKLEHLRQRCNLFLQGIQYAGQISQIIKSTANLCIMFKIPMQKCCLLAICKLVEFLKIIKTTFELKQDSIADSVQCICQNLEYQALFILQSAKKKVTTEVSTNYNERNIDVLSALQIAEKALYGPGTFQRIQVFRLALGLSDPASTFSVDYQNKLQKILFRLEIVTNLNQHITSLCDSTFLYWHQSLFPVYLKSLLENNTDLQKLQYVVHSVTDCSNLMLSRFKLDDHDLTFKSFQNIFTESIEDQVIKKLENNIEIFLRLDHHSNLQLEKFNPFMAGTASNMELYQKGKLLIQLKSMNVFGRHLLMKDCIEQYLSEMFYNLTTVTLHDWKTYGEIRCLANTKFDLKTIEDYLPTQQLEQGLDILEIMRNIHVFVAKYLYNLNNQIFIEQSSTANKHLNTINIRHIANSLRTHGSGIINTTVNFIYQFLRKKFATFSQFLFDEHIQSRLIKDLKYFRDNKERLNQNYSYERAETFTRGIRKLGVSPTGESYLDLFRTLISHIGNAMGYVRMIRSGGFHSCSEACVYLPTLETFDIGDPELKYSESFDEVFKNLQEVVKNLSNNYVEGTEYFQLLVTAFAPFFQNPKNAHLKNFYLIIPPLTLNFIEHLLSAKDKISKKNKDGAGHFTDDGFAMGIAYILKLLNQTSNFNSLHWFKSIRAKYMYDKEKLLQQTQTADKNDEKLQQTLLLTDRRITAFQQEFDLLYYNLSSAKIFFQ